MEANLVKFDAAKAEVDRSVKSLKNLIVTDEPSRAVVYDRCVAANKTLKLIEDKRRELVKPFNDAVKVINGYAKNELSAPLQQIIAEKKSGIMAWDAKVAEQRRKEQERIEAEQREIREKEAAKKMEADRERAAKMAEIESRMNAEIDGIPEDLKGVKRAERIREIKGRAEAAYRALDRDISRETLRFIMENADRRAQLADRKEEIDKKPAGKALGPWTYDVVALNEVPRNFLQVDHSAVMRAIKNVGTREIPGLKIYRKQSMRFA